MREQSHTEESVDLCIESDGIGFVTESVSEKTENVTGIANALARGVCASESGLPGHYETESVWYGAVSGTIQTETESENESENALGHGHGHGHSPVSKTMGTELATIGSRAPRQYSHSSW